MDESRKQFEEWVSAVISWDSMFLHSIYSDDDYHFEEVQTLWQAWQASRQALQDNQKGE